VSTSPMALFTGDLSVLDSRPGYPEKGHTCMKNNERNVSPGQKKHIHWTSDNWEKVLWSDETKISIYGSDGVRYVRRRPGEDNIPECTTATMKHLVSVVI